MATEEVPVTKETLDEKFGDMKIEEPAKSEDTTETPAEGTPEEAKEAVSEEPKETPPYVETKDTTDPVAEPTSEDGVVKAEVPEAVAEKETKPPSKISSVGDKISATLHKIVGKD